MHLHLSFFGTLLFTQTLAGVTSAQFTEVAAGRDHSLALRCDGTVEAWGSNWFGQCDVPALPVGLTYVEISAGGATEFGYGVTLGLSLARRSDGSVVAWGDNSYGQLDVPPLPPGLSYVEIAAGPLHGLARRSDGTVVAWGDNSFGQCNVPALPPGLSYVEISAGGWDDEVYDQTWIFGTYTVTHPSHSVALRSDGAVLAWGSNSHGQTSVPPLPPGTTYVEVSAGSNHTAARLSDGSVVAWGDNSFGQCDVLLPPPGLSYDTVEAGGGVTTALSSDGSALSWGSPVPASGVPEPPAGAPYADIAVGGAVNHDLTIYDFQPAVLYNWAYSQTIALRSDGSLVGWGENYDGQASVPAGWSFEDLSQGLAGTQGVPELTGNLDCPAGPGQPISVTLQGALPDSPSVLVIGTTRVDQPLLGGTLVPSPDLLFGGLTGPTGGQSLSGVMPPGFPPGQSLYFQSWVVDPLAPSQLSASNALSLTAP